MWLALVLPLLSLPALIGISRFEQRMMAGPTPGSASVRVTRSAPTVPQA